MVNKVILIGNVGLDPEVRTTEGGVKVARVRLATTERLFDRASNETKEHTEWHTITLWRGLADVVDRFVRKGSQIYIEGRLRTREWMDKDNNKRYTTEILADTMNLLGRRSDNPASDAAPAYGAAGGYGQQPAGGSSAGYRPQGGYGQPAPAQQPAAQPAPQPAPPADNAPDVVGEPLATRAVMIGTEGPSLPACSSISRVKTGGTDFQRSVWAALRTIPAGETWSYGRLASAIGKPAAVRAVGLANGANPVGVIVPCHRVVGANGTLTGYAGGLERKRWLLAHEKAGAGTEQGAFALD